MPRVHRAKLVNKKNLQGTFSKLRLDLFKEATEFCALGGKVLITVFSQSKKVYCFAHPNAEKMIEEFLSRDKTEPHMEARSTEDSEELSFRYEQLMSQLEVAKKRNTELKEKMKEIKDDCLWCQDIDELNKEQLIRLDASFKELHMKLEAYEESSNPASPVPTFGEPSSAIS